MVVVNHYSTVIGTIQPIKEIGKICKDTGVIFLVDASQSAGVVPIDVVDMGIDALAFTGHKSLMGPTGIGGSYVTNELPVKGTRFGGTDVRSAQNTYLTGDPYHLQYGTLKTIGVAGIHAGAYWMLEQGMEN